MSKIHKNITVDIDIWDNLVKIYPNQLSTKINMFLHTLYNSAKSNSNGFALAELNAKQNKLNQEITKLSAERENIKENIEFIKQKIEEKETKELQKQKEIADKLLSCDVCGIQKTEEKLHILPNGKICNSCYQTGDVLTLKKFMTKEAENE